ncbi:MAG: hypothetical protein R3270_02355 [Gammaproteobacteria bacterium]|nr:hypothetical protein [Gammaproteobacteria bacterium]
MSCVPGSNENHEDGFPRCVLCNERLRCLGGENIAAPFASRLGWFPSYPFRRFGLLLLLLIAGIAAILPDNTPGLIGLVPLFGFALHYSLTALDGIRHGRMTAPSIRQAFSTQADHLFPKLLSVIFLLGLFVGAAAFLGTVAAVGALVIVTLAIPAATMMLALTRSIREAVNPAKLFVLAVNIGPAYLLLWTCLVIAACGPVIALALYGNTLPHLLLFPAVVTGSAYFLIATYAMMGYLLFARQAELGFACEEDFGKTLEFRQYRVEKLLAGAKILAAEGRHSAALEALEEAVEHDRQDARLRDFYYRVVSATKDREAIERNTRSICEFYLGRGKPARAAEYCEKTISLYPDFLLKSADDTVAVAQTWFEHGKHDHAVRFLAALPKIAPEGFDHVPAQLLLARILFEGNGEDEKARIVLEKLRGQAEKHPLREEIERLLGIVTGMRARA